MVKYTKEFILKKQKCLMLQLRRYEVISSTIHHVCYIYDDNVIMIAVDNCKTEQFVKECIIAKRFSHPNVLSLIGVSYIKEEALPLMILPFMHNGDVKSFVKSKRKNALEVNGFPEVKLHPH